MIDLPPDQLEEVRRIVRQHLPGAEVFAFGSRAKGRAKKFSDLDLLVRASKPLPWLKLAEVRESFEESELPITVDVIDWAGCSETFRQSVSADLVSVFEN